MRDLIIKHRIFFGIIILLIVLTIPLTVIQVQQQQTLKQRASFTETSVSVAMNSPSKNLSVDEIVPVTIAINNPNNLDVSGADITLIYPADLFSYVSESFQPAGGNFTLIKTQSGSGTFQFVVANPTATPIVDGSINVGTLKFKSSAAGTASINFSAVTITAQGHDDLTVIPPTETYTYTISDAQRSDTASSSPTKYPLCWGGSFTVNALSGCELNITEDASCSSGYNKCLSADRISGAEEIDGKYLTCCNANEYGFTGNDECTLVADGEYSDPQCSVPIKKPAKESYKCTTYGYAKNDECKGESTSKINETDSLPDDSRTAPCAPLMDPLDNGDTWYSKTVCVKSSDITTNPTGSAKLTITNPSTNPSDPIVDHKGDLSYSFTGFQPGNIDVWVTKRGQNERTGDIVNPTATNGSGNSIIYGLSELAGEYTLWAKGSNGVSASADFTVKPTLTIKNPDSITEKGSLEYSFAGFQSDEAVKIWVVDSPTGYVINKQADASGKGNYTVDGLSELPKTWTLKIEGETPERSATASFTVIAAAAPAPGDTVIRLPAGAFNYLFKYATDTDPITNKDQNLTMYLYKSDFDLTTDLKGTSDAALKATGTIKALNTDITSFNFNTVSAGTYKILLKGPKHLRMLEGTPIAISGAGQTITLTLNDLTKRLIEGAGDVNDENVLSIIGYNMIIGCHEDKIDNHLGTCPDDNKIKADLNDDGAINGTDDNIFIKSLSFKTRQGD